MTLLFMGGLNVVAQQRRVDSLTRVVKTSAPDTTLCKSLYALSHAYTVAGKNDSAMAIAQRGLALAKKLNYEVGLLLAYENISSAYRRDSQYEKAIENNLKALELAEAGKRKRSLSRILGIFGIIYAEMGNLDKSLDYHQKAFITALEINDTVQITRHCGNVANIYNIQSNYPKALEYYFKALELGEKFGIEDAVARNCGNIGGVYLLQDDYDNALRYFTKAYIICEKTGLKEGCANHLESIGIAYGEKAKSFKKNSAGEKEYINKALKYFLKSLQLGEEMKSLKLLMSNYSNIGAAYSDMGDKQKAISYITKALEIAEGAGSKAKIAFNKGNLGCAYLDIKEYKKAATYLWEALVLSSNLELLDDVKDWYNALSRLYETSTVVLPDSAKTRTLGFEEMRLKSLIYLKRYTALRDTLFGKENKKQLIQKEMKYEFQKKEEIARAEQDKKDVIAAEKLKQKEQQRNYFISGFILAALFAVFILRGYRQKQKDNKIITEQKHLVEAKQKEILDSIYYARKIQRALITNEKYIEKNIERLTAK